MPELSIVIPTSGNHASLNLTLASLVHQHPYDPDRFEVFVCDDGTDDRVSEVVGRWSGILDVHCSRADAGRGAGYARNRGIEQANTSRVLLLDDDCLADPGVVHLHTQFGDRDVGIIGFRRMVEAQNHDVLARRMLSGEMHEVPFNKDKRFGSSPTPERFIEHLAKLPPGQLHKYAYTCHVSYPTAALWRVGGFWEQFRGAGYEDLELALRLQRSGTRLQVAKEPVVYHLNHPQSHYQYANVEHNRTLYITTAKDHGVTTRPGQLRKS